MILRCFLPYTPGARWTCGNLVWNGARSGAALLGLALALLVGAPTPADAASNTNSRAATAGRPARRPAAKAKPVRKTRKVAARKPAVVVPAKLSYGQIAGLHGTDDPLNLKSSVALVIDQDTDEVLFSKNSDAVLPIASITKLMTAMVVLQAGQPLDEVLTVTQDDVDTEKGSGSRLAVGTQLTRGEMLHLALMSSENRAANALGRHYPGGIKAFVSAMNAKAGLLGMHATRYVEPTGLSSDNQSSAHDLAMLVKAASDHAADPRAVHRAGDGCRGRAAGSCSSATPMRWCATRAGTSACRRPATSPRPAAAW